MKRTMLLLVMGITLVLAASPGLFAQNVQELIDDGIEKCQEGKYDAAISDFNQVLKAKPNDANIITFRGVAYYAKGQNDRALQDFNEALKINPSHPRAHYQRAMVYYHQQKYEAAIADLQKAKSLGHGIDPLFIEHIQREAELKKQK
jgi:tetratricopeptide (TPR) repeat protein